MRCVFPLVFFDGHVEVDGLDAGLPSIGFDGVNEVVGLDAEPSPITIALSPLGASPSERPSAMAP